MLYLKITNASYSTLFDELTNNIKIYEQKCFLSYWFTQYFDCFDPQLKICLAYQNSNAILSSLTLDNLVQDANFHKGVDNIEIDIKHAYFQFGVQYPLKRGKQLIISRVILCTNATNTESQ